jgi:thiol-disulfide isomerase/thioredoxin
MRYRVVKVLLPLVMLLLPMGGIAADTDKFVFDLHTSARPVADILFEDARGERFALSDFEGAYVLLNIWATWCPPCRKELPDLEALQRSLGGLPIRVIALSTDTGRLASVQRLYQELGLDMERIFIDQTGNSMTALGVYALPTTLLIDPRGQEIGRKSGPAEWNSAKAVAFFEEQLKPTP